MAVLSRRRFVGAAAAVVLSAGAALGWSKRFAMKLFLRFRNQQARPELLQSPVGKLSEAERSGLMTMANALGELWRFEPLDPAELAEIFDEKTSLAPSYLAEYSHALGWFEAARGKGASAVAAWEQCLTAPLKNGSEFSAEARVRTFFVEEVLNLYLAAGAFRAFGFQNYRGHWAGLVYRVAHRT